MGMNYATTQKVIDGTGRILDTTMSTPNVGSYVTEQQFADWVKGQTVVFGFLLNNVFYTDSAHTNPVVGNTTALYVDQTNGQELYRWTGASYVPVTVQTEENLSFKKIQELVRSGEIDNYLAIGDEITVEKETGITVTATGALTVTVTEATWNSHVEHLHHGVYEFIYDGYEWSEHELGVGLDMAYLGINITGTPVEGDVISVTVATATLVFQYVAKDKVTLRNPDLVHSAVFQLKNIYRNCQFAAAEAIIYASAAMPAGTYHFNLYKPSNIYYLNAGLQNKDVQFTTTVDIPAGGQLVLTTGSFKDSTSVDALKLTSYGSKGSTTALESGIVCSEGTSGTDLGRANDAANNTRINSTDRCVYGSNNWEYSGLRQWMNSDGAANTWYKAKGHFSRPYSNANIQGWMYGIEKDFLDVLQEVEVATVQNWFDGGAKKITHDKWFIPSNSQVYMSASGQEGDNWDYYKIFSDLSAPGTGADSNRIKKLNGSATYWWLRTPHGSYSHSEYGVGLDGSRSSHSGHGSIGVAPACVIA